MIDIDITKKLGRFDLRAAFEAPSGITVLFGRSGSGKTSLINAVAGIITPDAGHVMIGGQKLFDSATGANIPIHLRNVGYVFQDARLFPHMTVQQNLCYGGKHDAERIVDMLGLGPLMQRHPRHLSGGEQQRVALGRALMSDPDILLMDEPLAALDAHRKAEIMPYLARLRDTTEIPILYVSHDITEVARLATTTVMMRDGTVVCVGPTAEILADPALVPMIGARDAGAVIKATVSRIDAKAGLTTLTFSGGDIVLADNVGVVGQTVRIRVPAHDVILSRGKPEGISAMNVIAVTIAQIEGGTGPGAAIGLRAGADSLLARITQHSADRLALKVGDPVHAIIKATAVAPSDIDFT